MTTSLIGNLLEKSLRKVANCNYDKERPDPAGYVGIEIEVENVGWAPSSQWNTRSLWTLTSEGSLRDGIELVSVPVAGKNIDRALEDADTFLNIYTPHISFRTSVHIHVNVLDLTCEELSRLMKLYLYYEPAFFRLHKEWDRSENLFCIPTYASFEIQEAYRRLDYDLRSGVVRNNYLPWKYSALNSNSIYEHGTLEFRHMGGTSDMKAISSWINILLQLKEAARQDAPPDQPKKVFGKYYESLQVLPRDLEQGQELLDYIGE